MSLITRTVAVTAISFLAPLATANGQNCDALLQHGLRNVEVRYSSQASLATKWYRNCGLNFNDTSDSTLAHAEVEIFGSGGGGADFSRQQRETRLHRWCEENRELAQAAQSQYVQAENLMSEAVTAWSQCTVLASKGLQTQPIISADRRTVNLNVSYTGPSPIEFFGVESENFTCDTRIPSMRPNEVATLLDSGNPIPLAAAAVSVQCRRKVDKRQVGDQEYTWIERATISIRTSANPYLLFFPEETEPPLPARIANQIRKELTEMQPLLPPVGAVIGFALSPAAASSLAPAWLPADGRRVADPLSKLNGQTLPDLRNRLPLGAADADDASDNAKAAGGSLTDIATHLTGSTAELVRTRCVNHQAEARNAFADQNCAVWDTFTQEAACQHTHPIDGSFQVAELPWQPYRKLIYLVRVR